MRVRLRLRQIATLRLWDVSSNAENWYRTHSLRLRLRQIANKNAKNAWCEWTFNAENRYRSHSLHLRLIVYSYTMLQFYAI